MAQARRGVDAPDAVREIALPDLQGFTGDSLLSWAGEVFVYTEEYAAGGERMGTYGLGEVCIVPHLYAAIGER